jgi:hypothetical protein
VYTQYVKDHNRRLATIAECKTNPRFLEFLEVKEKNSNSKGKKKSILFNNLNILVLELSKEP